MSAKIDAHLQAEVDVQDRGKVAQSGAKRDRGVLVWGVTRQANDSVLKIKGLIKALRLKAMEEGSVAKFWGGKTALVVAIMWWWKAVA